jgi:hypothetical protein
MARSRQPGKGTESPIPHDTGSEGPKSAASAPKTTADRRKPPGKKETLPGAGKPGKPRERKASKE